MKSWTIHTIYRSFLTHVVVGTTRVSPPFCLSKRQKVPIEKSIKVKDSSGPTLLVRVREMPQGAQLNDRAKPKVVSPNKIVSPNNGSQRPLTRGLGSYYFSMKVVV